ncbi:hypothetical protein [Streptomyces sp. NPDC048669]|uniref:hypothetical protein n=1 Tax=Streptomyces sp. NPDC048669 TaxID=3155267 RepID=UPI0034473AE6
MNLRPSRPLARSSPITAAEMYSELHATRESVSRIEGKLDGLTGIKESLVDHEERLRSLEAQRWPWSALGPRSEDLPAVGQQSHTHDLAASRAAAADTAVSSSTTTISRACAGSHR